MTLHLYFAVYVCFLFIPVLSFELEMQKNWETRIPPPQKSPSPLACRCVLKLCVRLRAAADRSLQLPACLRGFFWGGRLHYCIPYWYMLAPSEQFFCTKWCWYAHPRQAHLSKKSRFCWTGCTACAMKRYVVCAALEKRWNGLCSLIWAGKSRYLGMGWTNLKRNFSSS